MPRIIRAVAALPVVVLLACSRPAAQSQQELEALQKQVEALKASQETMQRDLAEIREFLKAVSGGRFGAARLEGNSIDLQNAPANGAASARITMVEVSDYHCPFCRKHFQQTQPQIYSNYIQPGKVRHVFIHYPVDQLHPDAYRSHEAAGCAGDQGKFWQYHSKLFDSPVRTIDQLVALAPSAGVDASALRTCLDSGKYSKPVRESVARMMQLGVDSTPMFLIGLTPPDGQPMKVLKVIKGAHPYEQFKAAFDSL